jgi:hypothetical protein
MKHVTASLTIGTCLLLALTGIVLAANPHTVTGTTGQPGTVNGITCNTGAVGGGPTSGTGNGSANGVVSPFNTNAMPVYAGNAGNPTAPGGVGNPTHAVSEYDVACFQAP